MHGLIFLINGASEVGVVFSSRFAVKIASREIHSVRERRLRLGASGG